MSGALSGCLVIAPDCKRCNDDLVVDGGVSDALDSDSSNRVSTIGDSDESDGAAPIAVSAETINGSSTEDDGATSETGGGSAAASGLETDGLTTSSTDATSEATSEAGGSSSASDTAPTSGSSADSSDSSDSSDTGVPAPSDASDSDTSGPPVSTGVDTSEAPDTTSGGESTMPAPLVHEKLWEENFEGGWGPWTYEGAWAVGTPTNAAAPAPKAGSKLVGTGLEGAYHRENSRLSSPKFIVPPASRQPYLRYWYWYQLEADDSVQIQVRVGDEVNWVDLQSETGTISTVAGHGGLWMQALLPLEKFGDQEIQVSFALNATGENCSVPGFFIDLVSLETGPMNICSCQGFNRGNVGDWSIEGGQWGIGASSNTAAPDPWDVPDVQPNEEGLAGTNLAGSYESLAAAPVARLSSPTFKVANRFQRVRFYYWYSFAASGHGKIQSRTMGGEWQDLPDYAFTNASDSALTYVELYLEPWVGETVQFGFLHENGAGADTPSTPGFYIDEFFYIE